MFVAEVNYKSTESSIQDEVSYSDVENVAVSPEDNRVDVVNVEQSSIDDRLSDKNVRGDESRSWTMAKVQVGYDVTRKGERSLVVDGFKFTKSRDGTNNRVFWRCSRRECKATAVTVSDRVEHVRAIHAHEPPLAAEFFGSHEGVTQHCELQEVRFNTNAANMRPRYRRSNMSLSESNPDESTLVNDGSHSSNTQRNNGTFVEQKSSSIKLETISPQFKVQNIDIRPAVNTQPKISNSVKDQVREFILRNSSQISSYPQNGGVSVAQFLISPSVQSPFLHTNSTTSNNNSNSVSSSSCNTSTAFNFNPIHISALSNNGSDSTSDISSHKSTPSLLNVLNAPRNDSPVKTKSTNDTSTLNQIQIEQIIQMLLKNGSCRQRQASESEWCSPTPGPGIQQFDIVPNSPCTIISSGVPDSYQASTPSRFVHWKKEKLRESEICDQLQSSRKRPYEDYGYDSMSDNIVNTTTTIMTQSQETDTRQLGSFLNSFRPTITKKLMGVMQKLTAELCPEEAVAQEVYEKCTAIKTCLETLEKLHSLTGV